MNVLQVSHNYHIVGGSDAMFFATCELLNTAGHNVIPFCISHPRNRPTEWSTYFPKAADTRSAPVRDGIRYFYNTDANASLNRLLDDVDKIDVAHLHIYHGKHSPSILHTLRARGIPILHSLHEYKLTCPVYTLQKHGKPCDLCIKNSVLNCIKYRCKDGSILKSLVMAAESTSARLLGDVRLVDRFLCVSDFQKNIMLDAGLPANKLRTLHNFVNLGKPAKQGHDDYFLYFGRIEELKGLSTLVDAFRRSGHPLRIAGEGTWIGELQNAIDGHSNIQYLGFQSGANLNNLIRRSLAVIVPSEWNENCPMSLLEAKALGRPVVGADIGGISELIRPGIDGFLFKPGDPASLNTAIDQIRRANHQKLSKNAIGDMKSRFSKQNYLRELDIHYQEIIG